MVSTRNISVYTQLREYLRFPGSELDPFLTNSPEITYMWKLYEGSLAIPGELTSNAA